MPTAAALTYGAARENASRLASVMLRYGVQLGDPVLVHTADHAQSLVAQLAVLALGGVCVPVPDGAGERDAARIAEMSGATLVLCSGVHRERWALDAMVLDDARTWARIAPVRVDGSLPRSGPDDVAYLLTERTEGGGCVGHLVDHRAWLLATGARLRRAGRPGRGVRTGRRPGGALGLAALWWAISAGSRLNGPAAPATGRDQAGAAAVYGPEEYAEFLEGAVTGAPGTALVIGGALPAGLVARHRELLPYTRLLAEFSPRDGAMPWTAADCTSAHADGSGAGSAVPRVRVTVRDEEGRPVPAGATGRIWAAGAALPSTGCATAAVNRPSATGVADVLGVSGPVGGRGLAGDHRPDGAQCSGAVVPVGVRVRLRGARGGLTGFLPGATSSLAGPGRARGAVRAGGRGTACGRVLKRRTGWDRPARGAVRACGRVLKRRTGWDRPARGAVRAGGRVLKRRTGWEGRPVRAGGRVLKCRTGWEGGPCCPADVASIAVRAGVVGAIEQPRRRSAQVGPRRLTPVPEIQERQWAAREGGGVRVVLGKHAVVVGGSVAGLTAAGALAGRFERVTVLDRDALPSDAANRKGVPQARHSHALLIGGRLALEKVFPV
ncbi:AMP-binding protein [Streptomyces zhihengii]